MKANIAKAIDYVNKFIQSDWFILFTAVLVFIGWCFNAWVPLLCVLVAISTLPLFFGKDTKHLLVILMMFTFIISTDRHALNSFAPLLALVVVLFAGIIFNLIRFRRGRENWEFMHPTKIKGFHCTLIALIIPFALGGAGSPYEHPLAVVAALALIIVMALGYTFFMATNRDSEDKANLPQYLNKILFVSGILISLQFIVYFAKMGDLETIKQAILQKDINLGWAGKNNVAPTLAMCIPAGFYFSLKKSKLSPVFVLVSLFEYALLMFTGSRGTILFTTLAIPAMIIYTAVKTENKVAFGITVCTAFAVAVFLVAYFGEFMTGIIQNIIGRGLDSAGRTDGLYPEAFETFKNWPIFGAGWDYKLGEFAGDSYTPYWYHSTALQVLATMGIVGVITFVFFYFWRYRTLLFYRKNPAYVALLLSLALFDAYGMIDTNFFGPTFFLMLLCISFVADINLPDDKCRAFGGRNPFADIASACKRAAASIKNKRGAKNASVSDTQDTSATTSAELPDAEVTVTENDKQVEQTEQTKQAELSEQNEQPVRRDDTASDADNLPSVSDASPSAETSEENSLTE